MLLASAAGSYFPERIKYYIGQIQNNLTNGLYYLENVTASCESPGYTLWIRLFAYSNKNSDQITFFSGLFVYCRNIK